MKKLIFLLLVIVFSCFWCSSMRSNLYKVTNEDTCQKKAKEIFIKEYKDRFLSDEVATINPSYSCYYSEKLKKCFLLVRETIRPKDTGKPLLIQFLVDLDKNESYGSFLQIGRGAEPLEWNVNIAVCDSQVGWHTLIRQFWGQNITNKDSKD
jgi:hypothetical protein